MLSNLVPFFVNQVYGALVIYLFIYSKKKKRLHIYIYIACVTDSGSYHYLGGNAKDQVGDNKAFGQ